MNARVKIRVILLKHPDKMREWGAEAPVELPHDVVGFNTKSGLVAIAYEEEFYSFCVRITYQENGAQLQIGFIPKNELINIIDRMVKGKIEEEDIQPLQDKWVDEFNEKY